MSWRIVLWGLGLQLAFAVDRAPHARSGVAFFQHVNTVVRAVLGYAAEGGRFVVGNLVSDNVPGGRVASRATVPSSRSPGMVAQTGAFFAFQVLPNIIFVSCLMTVLYHLGIMQRVVRAVAWVMQRTLRTSGAETLDAASNIFVGMMESPLVVKPFVERMTESELMAIMTAGMATISGGVLAAYAGMLLPYQPDAAGHLIAASVMSAPAAFVLAKLLVPETGTPVTAGSLGRRASGAPRRERHRRGGAGSGRGPPPGARGGRHAGGVHRPGVAARRRAGVDRGTWWAWRD